MFAHVVISVQATEQREVCQLHQYLRHSSGIRVSQTDSSTSSELDQSSKTEAVTNETYCIEPEEEQSKQKSDRHKVRDNQYSRSENFGTQESN